MPFGDIKLNMLIGEDGVCRCHGLLSPVHTSNGDIARVTDARDCIWQRLGVWLATKKGERPLNPRLGCCIKDYFNQPLTYSKLLDLRGDLERELKAVFPEFKVSGVKVEVPERDTVKVSATIGETEIEFLGNPATISSLESHLSRVLADLGMQRC